MPFADGFPNDPRSAIEHSYWFTDDEKNEWYDWLNTATGDEKEELVEMLHRIWPDRQSQTVPETFNSQPASLPVVQSTPEPQNSPQNPPFFGAVQPQSIPPAPPLTFPATENFQSSETQSKIEPQSPNINPPFDQMQMPEMDLPQGPFSDPLQNRDNSVEESFDSNPVLQGPRPDPTQFGLVDDSASAGNTGEESKPQPSSENAKMRGSEELTTKSFGNTNNISFSSGRNGGDGSKNRDERSNRGFMDTKGGKKAPLPGRTEPQRENTRNSFSDNSSARRENSTETESQAVVKNQFSISKVRQTATREQLNNLYDKYIQSRQKLTNNQQNHDQNYDDLFQKIVQLLLNFESVTDYLESMTTKLMNMNSVIMNEAEKNSVFKSDQKRTVDELGRKVKQIQSGLDQIVRENDEERQKISSSIHDLEILSSRFSANSYTDESGILAQLDMLNTRLSKLEKTPGLDQKTATDIRSNSIPVKNRIMSQAEIKGQSSSDDEHKSGSEVTLADLKKKNENTRNQTDETKEEKTDS